MSPATSPSLSASSTPSTLQPGNPVDFGANNPTTVTIDDLDPGIAFATNNFFVLKSATNVLITVVRSNVNTGTHLRQLGHHQ